jgi:hypothetical protein
MDAIVHIPTSANTVLGSTIGLPRSRRATSSVLRLRGKISYWHKTNGKLGTWGVVKSDARTKYHVHLSEFRNTSKPPARDQRVEFSPKRARAPGELKRAVDVFVMKGQCGHDSQQAGRR